MSNDKVLNNELSMLNGNICRIMISDDVLEIERMKEWAHKRIDVIVELRLKNEREKVIEST